jgi:hypothetical protein
MRKYLIAEKDFVENLFISQNNSKAHEDLYSFIIHDYSGYQLLCDFRDLDEYKSAMEENPIWELLIDKFEHIYYSDSINPECICDDHSISHGIFLINDNKKCKAWREKYELLFITFPEIELIWGEFKDIRKGFQLKVTKSNIIPEENKLDNWSKIRSFWNPMKDLVIFDKYILVDKSNQRLKDNLFPLLENILAGKSSIFPYNITIITEKTKSDNFCIKQRHQAIVDYLALKGITNFKLNIVKHSKAIYPLGFEGLHSRFILSNYFHFKCDDSLNFFKSNGKINNDADVRVNFVLNDLESRFFTKELNDVKTYLEKVENNPDHPEIDRQLMFYPDKSNRILC